MLETTDVELGLLSDIDMLLFCEKAIRGVLNGVWALIYFRANNKYLPVEMKFGRNENYGGIMERK